MLWIRFKNRKCQNYFFTWRTFPVIRNTNSTGVKCKYPTNTI